MTNENFLKAIMIIKECHTTQLFINKVEKGQLVTEVLVKPTIHIKDCCAAVVNRLTENGFSVSMGNGLMAVNKYL